MWCQIWQFQFRSILKMSRKRKKSMCEPHQWLSQLQLFYCFLTTFFLMFKCINTTSKKNKKCTLDKTGERNEVLDLTILAQKYPKTVKQQKEIVCNLHKCFSKLQRFLRLFDNVFHIYSSTNKTPEQNNKCSLDKTGE